MPTPPGQFAPTVLRPQPIPTGPSHNGRVALIAAAAVIVLALVGVFVWVVASGSGSDNPSAQSATSSRTETTTTAAAPDVALDVTAPLTRPACDGTGIVVLGNAVTPGRYDTEIQQFLNAFPGASYLRTDRSCSSLRQRSDTGTPIYAVYRPIGRSQADVCAVVRAAGGGAYGKWLDNTTDPSYIIPC